MAGEKVQSEILTVEERQQWVDLCRVVSIYGVILLHSCGATFYQYGSVPLTDWLSANILDSAVRSSVPLFVMISGALILPRYNNSLEFVGKRVFKVVIPLIVWSLAYLFFVSHHNGQPVQWLSIFEKPAMYHLWFVYMIIGLYLLIPLYSIILAVIIRQPVLQIYLFFIWFIITSIPVYVQLPLLHAMQLNNLLGYGGYFLIGGVVSVLRFQQISNGLLIAVLFFCTLLTFALTWYLSSSANSPIETAYLYFSPNVVFSSIAAFVLFTRVSISDKFKSIILFISDGSFFIYFIHVLVLEYVRYSSIIMYSDRYFPALLTIVIISLLTFLISICIASCVRLLPGVKRVLG